MWFFHSQEDHTSSPSAENNIHTYTRLTTLCLGLPGKAGTRNIKTNLDFTEARDSEWQWHQLGYMQLCTSLKADNHSSTPPLSFLQAGCPSCCPTNSVKALKATCNIHTKKISSNYHNQYEGTETVQAELQHHLPNLNAQPAITNGVWAVKLRSNKAAGLQLRMPADAGCPV